MRFQESWYSYKGFLVILDGAVHLGPILEIGFGPPTADFGSIWSSQKARKFLHFQNNIKSAYFVFWPLNHLTKNLLSNLIKIFNFRPFLLLEFCLSPKFFGPLSFLCYQFFWSSSFLVLPIVFGPPTMVAAVLLSNWIWIFNFHPLPASWILLVPSTSYANKFFGPPACWSSQMSLVLLPR